MLPAEHTARQVWAYVESLDLSGGRQDSSDIRTQGAIADVDAEKLEGLFAEIEKLSRPGKVQNGSRILDT